MKLAKSQPHSAAKLLSRKQIQSCCKSPVRSTQAVWKHKLRVCQSSGCASAFIPCSLLRLTGNADSWSCRDSSTDLGNYHETMPPFKRSSHCFILFQHPSISYLKPSKTSVSSTIDIAVCKVSKWKLRPLAPLRSTSLPQPPRPCQRKAAGSEWL